MPLPMGEMNNCDHTDSNKGHHALEVLIPYLASSGRNPKEWIFCRRVGRLEIPTRRGKASVSASWSSSQSGLHVAWFSLQSSRCEVKHLVGQLKRALQRQDTGLKAAVIWLRRRIRRRRRAGQLCNATLQIAELQIGKLQFLVAVGQILLQLRDARREIPDLLFGLIQGCHIARHDGADWSAGAINVGRKSLERLKGHRAWRATLDVGAHEIGQDVSAELMAAVELLAADDRRSTRLEFGTWCARDSSARQELTDQVGPTRLSSGRRTRCQI